MTQPHPPGAPLPSPRHRPAASRRRALRLGAADLVTVRPFGEDHDYPILITPNVDGLELSAWAAAHRDDVERLLRAHRALLFRGSRLGGVQGFGEVVKALFDGPPLPYRHRSTPRESYGGNIYCTTTYPPDQRIRLHNEGSLLEPGR